MNSSNRLGISLLVGAITLFGSAAGGCNSRKSPNLSSQQMEAVTSHFERGDYQAAYDLANSLMQSDSVSVPLLLLAAESATKLERFDEALSRYAQIPNSAGEQAAVARWAAGEIYFHLGQATKSVESLQASLRLDPDYEYAHERLLELFNTLGRRRETIPHLMALLRMNRVNIERLLYLGNLFKEFESSKELSRYLTSNPDDLLPNLGLARIAIRNGNLENAEELLNRLLIQQPDLLEAHVQLGMVWLKSNSGHMADWNLRLPKTAEQNPDVWYVRGQWRRLENDNVGAVGCFARCVQIDPNHLPAHSALAQQFKLLGNDNLAQKFATRAEKLQQLNITLEQIYVSRGYCEAMEQAAILSLELGRLWESISWCANAQQLEPDAKWPREVLARAQAVRKFDLSLPQTLPEFNLVSNADWTERFPLPDFRKQLPETLPGNDAVASDNVIQAIKLVDVSRETGLEFQFYNPSEKGVEGRRMLEITGGGIGIIDFDRDGWYEMFLAQGIDWPPATSESRVDVLVRNLGPDNDGQVEFREVTGPARISEKAFGQGVAVGDINGDGFDDIYVCNVGRNQLWLNAGDGTFMDGNPLIASAADTSWTVSAAIVDLDLDGSPEIYDANYVQGEDIFTRRCPIAGRPRGCSPLVFSPARHAVWVPSEGGVLHEYPQEQAEPLMAYGLGVVGFRLEGQRRPSVFVAVDQQANLLLVSQEDERIETGFSLHDEALVRGLAFDDAGRAQACMGIATGDANQDGTLDLFVTNFYNEYNTLYLQEGGLFTDSSLSSGLVSGSLPMLGFGTQAVDLQLDGYLDYVVLNGHVDDQTHIGVPEKMRPQVYANLGAAKFRECSPEVLGDFFKVLGLGRGLARIDFNRDGLDDLVCGDLEKPLVLLQNESEPVGVSLQIYLVGTRSERNGTCSICRLTGQDFQSVQQQVAGGGYLVSNEPGVRFTVPRELSAFSLNIDWSSGTQDTWSNLSPGSYIAVEGQGITRLPR